MAGITFSEKRTQGDLIRYDLKQDYTWAPVTIYNRTGSTITATDIMGYPLRPDSSIAGAYMFVMAGGESYTNALCLSHATFVNAPLANNTSHITKALVRGPAIIDKAFIPTTDLAGAAFTLATIVTAVQAFNPPILCNAEPAITVTQVN